LAGLAFSEQYPEANKTITILCISAPGGSTDVQIRALSAYLSKYLGGVKIQVENAQGASGKIAYERTSKAKPDGYTMLGVNLIGPIILELQEKASTRYKILEFTPIYAISSVPFVLVVHMDNWKTVEDFLQEAQKRVVTIGVTGKNTGNYLQAVAFAEAAKIKANLVPFEGGAESTATLAGKHIDAVITPVLTALPLVRAGKFRPLIVFTDEADSTYPGVPLSKDTRWNVATFPLITNFWAPPNLPSDKLKVLEEAFSKTLKDPAFLEWAKKVNLDIIPLDAEKVKTIIIKTYEYASKYGSFSDVERK
jgi:tripartite-type tricarboxylate transporter receptor subunit TctC